MGKNVGTGTSDNPEKQKGNSVESLVAAADGISSAIEEIAKQIEVSSKVVDEAANQSESASKSANLLGDAAKSIGEVVGVIDKIAKQINLLALNATIEAARAGEAGKGFSVVAREVKNLSTQTAEATNDISEKVTSIQTISKDVISVLEFLNTSVLKVNEYSGNISSTVATQTEVLDHINTQAQDVLNELKERDAIRLTEMAQTLVQLIVRNLYERTADVRWWATDEAFYHCMEHLHDEASCSYASNRLGIINKFYSVYMNLLLVDVNGQVVVASQPDKFANAVGGDVSKRRWFREAMKTAKGDEYVVDDIFNDPIHNDMLVSVYSTAVREGGKMEGTVTGVLGVFFDWQEQSRVVVCDEPTLSDEEWSHSTVMLLDSNLRIIASSDNKGLLETFDLKHGSRSKGHYYDGNRIVAFARTIGYQEYDGLGWYGVVVQEL